MSERFAVYYAPPRDSLCWTLGTAWLGRDPERGDVPARPAAKGLDAATVAEAIRAPAHYGFHATLKPPFALAEGATRADLEAALDSFARTRTAFLAPAPRVAALDGFIALVPGTPDGRIVSLAEACVRAFDSFRAAPSADEIARRQAAGLSPRQAAMLALWGYPYVMDQFRFHMTLSGRLPSEQRDRVLPVLEGMFAPACAQRLPIDGLALYRQPAREAPFDLVARFPFGAAAG